MTHSGVIGGISGLLAALLVRWSHPRRVGIVGLFTAALCLVMELGWMLLPA